MVGARALPNSNVPESIARICGNLSDNHLAVLIVLLSWRRISRYGPFLNNATTSKLAGKAPISHSAKVLYPLLLQYLNFEVQLSICVAQFNSIGKKTADYLKKHSKALLTMSVYL